MKNNKYSTLMEVTMAITSVRKGRLTGKPIKLKTQQSDAIQKVIYERPGRTQKEILARATQLFSHLKITTRRIRGHIKWATDPSKRKRGEWLKIDTNGRVWPAVEIWPEWQL